MHTAGMFLDRKNNIIEYMDQFNVEKAVLTTINRSKEVIFPKDHQLPHQDVIEIAKLAPERLYKFFWFNPKIKPIELEEDNYKVLEEHFNQGFIGVKLHPFFNDVNIPEDVIKLGSFMQDYDKNLMLFIHSTPKSSRFKGVTPSEIARLAKKYPDLRIIVGHAAFCIEYAVEVGMVLNKFQNVFFETSCSVSQGIYLLTKTVGHERILFGSDSPAASALPVEIQNILSIPRLSDGIKQDIFYNNIDTLLSK